MNRKTNILSNRMKWQWEIVYDDHNGDENDERVNDSENFELQIHSPANNDSLAKIIFSLRIDLKHSAVNLNRYVIMQSHTERPLLATSA